MTYGPFNGLLRLARHLLEERDIRRIIEPTIADALHERSLATRQWVWLWQSRGHLVCAILRALGENARRKLVQSDWEPLLVQLLAGLSGSIALGSPHAILAHCVYLVLGVLCSLCVVCSPTGVLRWFYVLSGMLAVVAIAVCPWLGVAIDSQRQWLSVEIAPSVILQVHVSTLFLPVYAAFVGRSLMQGKYMRLFMVLSASIGLLALQPNWQAALVCGLVPLVVMVLTRVRASIIAFSVAVVAGGLVTLWRTAAFSWWTVAGNAALLLAISWSARSLWRRHAQLSAVEATVFVALGTLTALSGWLGDPLPVVGFGGSAIIACFTLLALQLRAASNRSDNGHGAVP